MEMEYFPCYNSYLKKCEKLTDQELGRLFRSLMKYNATGERQELAGRESIAFDFIADDIDRAKASYQEKCVSNSKNGKLGGRPKKQPLPEKANGFLESQKSQSKDKSKDKSKEKETSPVGDGKKDAIAAVMSAYMDKITPTPSTSSIDELAGYVEQLGQDVCLRAIDAALDANARNWNYVKAILQDKQRNGVHSLADWDALDKNRGRKQEKQQQPWSYDPGSLEGSL